MTFPSTTMVPGTMVVSHMVMMVLHGVMMVMVKRRTVSLTVQVSLCSLCSVIIVITNLCLVECQTILRDPCAFPFNWKGKQHYECITDDNDGRPWCVTDASGAWHYCKSDCPGNIVEYSI